MMYSTDLVSVVASYTGGLESADFDFGDVFSDDPEFSEVYADIVNTLM